MKSLLVVGLLSILSVANAADFKMSSRTYEENNKGEIIQVDGKTVNAAGEEVMTSEISIARINNSNKTYTNTQHILIPATSEVRRALLESSGQIEVEGSVLDTNIETHDIATFKQIKILVREVR